MAVMRLADGSLALWSPVASTAGLRAAVATLGPVRWLIAPNSLHDLFLADWAHACPWAGILGAPGLQARRPDLPLVGTLGVDPLPGLDGQIDVALFETALTTEAVLFHRASGTALFCDLLQQMPAGWYRGWRALVARADLMTGPEPQVPRKFRLAMRDKAAARAALDRVWGWPVSGVVMAHGTPVDRDAAAFLRRAFGWLRW